MFKFYTSNGKISRNSIVLSVMTIVLSLTSLVSNAQCPPGSVPPVNNQNYNNGDVVCISVPFSGTIKLTNGATMVVVAGGNFTGTIVANPGSAIEIYKNGTFSPSGMWNFKGSIHNFGTAVLNNATFDAGASIINDGEMSSNSFQNFNAAVPVTNNVCGVLNVDNFNVSKVGQLLKNKGRINIQSQFVVAAGARVENSGRVYVAGLTAISGFIYNESWMVFKSSNNTFSTGNVGDSIVNLHYLIVNSTLAYNKPVRNEGLFVVNGTLNFNTNGRLVQNEPSALIYVAGAMNRSAAITSGGKIFLGGTDNSNGNSIAGISALKKLTANKTLNNSGSFVDVVTLAATYANDTANFVTAKGAPTVCNSAGGSLPVLFTGIEAVAKGNTVFVNWITHMEVDHDYFQVEYSTDGKTFTLLENVKGKGQGQSVQKYTYAHSQPVAGLNFYRLKVVSTSGQADYSQIVKVNLNSTLKVGVIRTYPNPFIDKVNVDVELERNQLVHLLLTDNTGKLIQSKSMQLSAGKHTLDLERLGQYARGVYFLTLKTQEDKITVRLMK